MPRPSRALPWLLSVCLAFVGGIAFECSGREAQAQSAGISTLYVPAGGLVFRAMDGHPLARISEDAHGGAFELYDDRREVAARLHPSRTPALAQQNPYTLDERDPWTPAGPPRPPAD
ncbi:MAG TPA: hypothetical protein VHS09_05950 [Polyangiaceae bacterium]|nr:hypothetical protein [Polyangiaceae bacterium]